MNRLLAQLADETTQLQQRLTAVYVENDRIKTALKQWQTDHAATCRNFADPGRRDWPINHSHQHG